MMKFFFGMFLIAAFALAGCRSPVFKNKDTGSDSDLDSGLDSGLDGGDSDSKLFEQCMSAISPVPPKCPKDSKIPYINACSPYMGGEEDELVEVSVFANFHCIHCAHFAEEVREIWNRREDFKKHVRFYFHHSPWSSSLHLHKSSVAMGLVEMDYFWDVHDYLFKGFSDNYTYYTQGEVDNFAKDELNCDMDKYHEYLSDPKLEDFIWWDSAQGTNAGVYGTPAAFVCGEIINRSDLEEIVDDLLK